MSKLLFSLLNKMWGIEVGIYNIFWRKVMVWQLLMKVKGLCDQIVFGSSSKQAICCPMISGRIKKKKTDYMFNNKISVACDEFGVMLGEYCCEGERSVLS